MSLDVKLYFTLPNGQEIAHRWLLDEAQLFDSLLSRLESLCASLDPRLNCSRLRFGVAWWDGEDWCTLSTPQSMAEAVSANREMRRRPLKLRASLAQSGDVALTRDVVGGAASSARDDRSDSDASSLISDVSLADLPPSPSMKASGDASADSQSASQAQAEPSVEVEDEKADDAPEQDQEQEPADSALLSSADSRSDAELVEVADGYASDEGFVRVEDENHPTASSSSSSHSSNAGSQSASAHLQAPLESFSRDSSGPPSSDPSPTRVAAVVDLGVHTPLSSSVSSSHSDSESKGTSTDEAQSAEFATQTPLQRQATPIPTQTESENESQSQSAAVQVEEEEAEEAAAEPQVDESAPSPSAVEIDDVTGHFSIPSELTGSPEPRVREPNEAIAEQPAQIDDVTGHHQHQQAESSSSGSVVVEDEAEEEKEEAQSLSLSASSSSASSRSSSISKPAPVVSGPIHRGITCDGCGASPLVGVRYHCTLCVNPGGFDLCEACEAAGDKHPPSHVLLKLRTPAHIPVGSLRPLVGGAMRAGRGVCPRDRSIEKPRATFVSDLTVADDVVVHAGETLRKVWSVRNSGSAPWPQPTRLVFVGGDLEPSSSAVSADRSCALVPFAGPGDVVHISLDIVVPREAGRFRSTFRLQGPDGVRFGPRVWISIVVPPEQQTQAQPQPQPQAQQQAAASSSSAPAPAKKEQPKAESPKHAAPSAAAATAPVPVSESKQSEEDRVAQPLVSVSSASPSVAAASASSSISPSVLPRPRPLPAFPYGNQLATLRSMGFTDAELCRYLLLNNSGDVQKVVAWLINHSN